MVYIHASNHDSNYPHPYPHPSLYTVCNFGQEWEVSEIETKTQYRAGLREEIDAEIEVKIGLRSVNITLKGKFFVLELNYLI